MFRRFIGSLRRQDWTAVLIELVVVVAGVFIGLQASNWNERLRSDEKAAEFTERLRADLREEAWAYEYEIGYSDEVIANAKRAADALSGKVASSDEALLVAAYRATQYVFNVRRRATYDELTSTGEIGLVRDPSLRDLAMRVYTMPIFNGILDEGQNNLYRKAFRMAIPHDVQEELATTCGDRVVLPGDYKGIQSSLDYPCAPKLSPEVVSVNAAIMHGDPQFLRFLRLRIADVSTNQINLKLFYSEVREGLQALAREKPSTN
jgi:hypothetical protein